jgi:signal peptidase I
MVDEATAKRRTQAVLLAAVIAVGVVMIGAFGWFILSYRMFTQASGSMEPTHTAGDLLLVARGATFSVGDVVAFRHGKQMWIKRIVAKGGDRVQMKAGLLYVNGVTVPRQDAGATDVEQCWNGTPARRYRETNGSDYLTLDCGPDGQLDETVEIVVPAGHYFMMGDNRDNSLDSRVSVEQGGIGLPRAESVFGKIVWTEGEAQR